MGDPFADLLTQFKGDKLKPKREGEETLESTGQPLGNLEFEVNQIKHEEHLGSAPYAHTSGGQNVKKGDDFEDLFSPMSSTHQIKTAPNTVTQDEFDTAFDLLQTTPSKSDFSVEPERRPRTQPDLVVDEVRDMEVAKLMSLGLSIEDANAYYEKGMLYEDVIKASKRKKQQKRQMQRRMAQVEWEKEDPISPEGGESRESSVDLLSIAAGIFNKGKRLVDQFTIFPEGDDDQLAEQQKFRQRQLHQSRPPPRPQRKARELSKKDLKAPQAPEPPQEQLREGDLLNDFGEKLAPNKEKNSSASPAASPQDEGTLLDFDDEPTAPQRKLASPVPTVPVSEIELSGYNEFKERATELFKNGDYVTALQEFEKSVNTLPQGHPLRIISYANVIASQLKTGQHKEGLHVSEIALSLFPEDASHWSQTIQNSEPARTYRDMWPKIALRRAEAFEHSENYKDAFTAYQALVEHNFCTDKVLDGKRRCLKVLKPEKPKVVKRTPSPSAASQQPDQHYKHLEKVKEDNRKQAEIETQRDALYDQVHQQIESWKAGKPEDLRHLISNLQVVIAWSNWTAVPPSNLVMPKKVKLAYLKAAAKTHPDKIPASLPLEQKMVAESVFSTLSVAWEKFKTENDIN